MPALPTTRETLRGLATRTAQGVSSVNAALRRALARLITGGQQPGSERRMR